MVKQQKHHPNSFCQVIIAMDYMAVSSPTLSCYIIPNQSSFVNLPFRIQAMMIHVPEMS